MFFRHSGEFCKTERLQNLPNFDSGQARMTENNY